MPRPTAARSDDACGPVGRSLARAREASSLSSHDVKQLEPTPYGPGAALINSCRCRGFARAGGSRCGGFVWSKYTIWLHLGGEIPRAARSGRTFATQEARQGLREPHSASAGMRDLRALRVRVLHRHRLPADGRRAGSASCLSLLALCGCRRAARTARAPRLSSFVIAAGRPRASSEMPCAYSSAVGKPVVGVGGFGGDAGDRWRSMAATRAARSFEELGCRTRRPAAPPRRHGRSCSCRCCRRWPSPSAWSRPRAPGCSISPPAGRGATRCGWRATCPARSVGPCFLGIGPVSLDLLGGRHASRHLRGGSPRALSRARMPTSVYTPRPEPGDYSRHQ